MGSRSTSIGARKHWTSGRSRTGSYTSFSSGRSMGSALSLLMSCWRRTGTRANMPCIWKHWFWGSREIFMIVLIFLRSAICWIQRISSISNNLGGRCICWAATSKPSTCLSNASKSTRTTGRSTSIVASAIDIWSRLMMLLRISSGPTSSIRQRTPILNLARFSS